MPLTSQQLNQHHQDGEHAPGIAPSLGWAEIPLEVNGVTMLQLNAEGLTPTKLNIIEPSKNKQGNRYPSPGTTLPDRINLPGFE